MEEVNYKTGDDGYQHNEKAETQDGCSTKHINICHEVEESVDINLVGRQDDIYVRNLQRSAQSQYVTDNEVDKENKQLCEISENQKKKGKNHDTIINARIFKCSFCADYGEYNAASCFCTSCEKPEPLCNSCGRHHIRQKNLRNHLLSTDMQAFILYVEKNTIYCALCLLDGEQNSASSLCLTCKEPEALCDGCASQHVRQRAFRNHQISNDLTKLPKKEKLWCESCTIEGSKTPADSFCKDCDGPEPLCKDCARQHIKQRQFRHHSISGDISQIQLKIDEKCRVLCVICKEEGINADATSFCQDCNDQTSWCLECARQHIRQKCFRGHKLCNDLSLLRNVKGQSVFCNICRTDGKNELADAYCTDCSDPEPLCISCAGQHVKQKQFRNHEICRDISFLIELKNPDDAQCDICMIDRKNTKARKYCNNCNERLCIECVEAHRKFSRDHVLTDDISNSVCCKPCKRGNIKSSADSFCENCVELMCKTCSEQHIRHKPSEHHIICSNMLKFLKSIVEKEKVEGKASQKLDTEDISERKEREDKDETKEKVRGKPIVLELMSDSVELCWEILDEELDYYQIRFKSLNENEKWKFCNTRDSVNRITIRGLMAKTSYIFQVRKVANDIEGEYSDQSDPIQTAESLATKMLKFSIKIPNTDPIKYQLTAKENKEARNMYAKTRVITLGNPSIGTESEKTLMLVGATGSGKSTLVDGIINYILGVSFEDPFRFTLVSLEHEEKKTNNQAESQTEWITVYKIAPQEGSRLDSTLNVIDTPGFGDTRGIKRDKAIVDQIRHLFSAESKQGVAFIDAVCFLVKAPDARLTATQTYIFHSIMSLFGKDIESNICTLITFADGAEPPVLSCLKAANLPFGTWFPFNNSALFAKNKNLENTSLSPMFWDMGCKSFQNFFEIMNTFTTKSLKQTKDVLKQREHLQSVLTNIQPKVNAGLMKINELQNTLDLFKKHQNDIDNNKDFTYELEITKQIKLELPIGQHVTNCLNCNLTCHEKCEIPDDADKRRCTAMDTNGKCKVCSGKCNWNQHKNAKYIFKYVTEKKTETYQEKKKLYEKAKGEQMTNEKYLKEIETDIDFLFSAIKNMMEEMARCKNRLKEIALRPDPLSAVEHIDQMIQAEEIKKQLGYEQRIKVLIEFKQFAQIDQSVKSFEQTVKKAKDEVSKTTGRKNEGKQGNSDVSNGGEIERGLFHKFTSLFK